MMQPALHSRNGRHDGLQPPESMPCGCELPVVPGSRQGLCPPHFRFLVSFRTVSLVASYLLRSCPRALSTPSRSCIGLFSRCPPNAPQLQEVPNARARFLLPASSAPASSALFPFLLLFLPHLDVLHNGPPVMARAWLVFSLLRACTGKRPTSLLRPRPSKPSLVTPPINLPRCMCSRAPPGKFLSLRLPLLVTSSESGRHPCQRESSYPAYGVSCQWGVSFPLRAPPMAPAPLPKLLSDTSPPLVP